jgi:hypothetical protein
MGAQQANVANNLAAWQQMGNWGQSDTDRDFMAWQLENQYANQDYQDQQQLLPMLMAMFGGGG